ncbi:hypothetical protein THAOC_09978 [Thalassiosira oceanica]|uniref:Uncharacterized protein n=1 Tax=Thalassiosira oceanica TaxID=159749 RepID=K0SV41_THAOC|nr:hypothetical protein THAOC_09978 [Thalassiosira oceanica]|eukprot:EJK68809.1 hypothetical protein THAOC_09978 [Thalassiosira oceanica]
MFRVPVQSPNTVVRAIGVVVTLALPKRWPRIRFPDGANPSFVHFFILILFEAIADMVRQSSLFGWFRLVGEVLEIPNSSRERYFTQRGGEHDRVAMSTCVRRDVCRGHRKNLLQVGAPTARHEADNDIQHVSGVQGGALLLTTSHAISRPYSTNAGTPAPANSGSGRARAIALLTDDMSLGYAAAASTSHGSAFATSASSKGQFPSAQKKQRLDYGSDGRKPVALSSKLASASPRSASGLRVELPAARRRRGGRGRYPWVGRRNAFRGVLVRPPHPCRKPAKSRAPCEPLYIKHEHTSSSPPPGSHATRTVRIINISIDRHLQKELGMAVFVYLRPRYEHRAYRRTFPQRKPCPGLCLFSDNNLAQL